MHEHGVTREYQVSDDEGSFEHEYMALLVTGDEEEAEGPRNVKFKI